MSSKMQNKDRLLQKMAAMPAAVRKRLGEANDKTADQMVGMAQRLAPVKSGKLKRSIKKVTGDYTPDNPNVRGFGGPRSGDPELTKHVVAGDKDAWYPALVEFGTSKHPNRGLFRGTEHPGTDPSPFFYPAWRAVKRPHKARARRAVRKGLTERT